MTVRWKNSKRNGKGYNPTPILNELESSKSVTPSGIRFDSYFGIMTTASSAALLENYLDWPEELHLRNRVGLLETAILKSATKAELTSESLLIELTKHVNEFSRLRLKRFHLLTSVSLNSPIYGKRDYGGITYRMLKSDYPKKYNERLTQRRWNVNDEDGTPKEYTKIVVTVQAKHHASAGWLAIDAIDVQRAIWCLIVNPEVEVTNDNSPINRIRLGKAHTLHKDDGRLASSHAWWYEPVFVKRGHLAKDDSHGLASKSDTINKQLATSRFSKLLKASMLIYVRALDESDHSACLRKLWTALEALTIPPSSNYDLLVKRVSAIFSSDRNYHLAILNHLKESRNIYTHRGFDLSHARILSLQIAYYYKTLFNFLLDPPMEFKNLDDAWKFLDLPDSTATLENRKTMINSALKFRGKDKS